MSSAASSAQQAQSFRDLRVEGENNSLVINQTVVISPAAVQAQPFVERSPYIGLRRFEEKDQALFFGRDAVIAKLLLAVRERPMTLVAGASGSGKSSVVRAGLIPHLHERLARLRVLTLVPDRDPFARLQAALLQSGFDLDQVGPAREVSEHTLVSLCSTLRAADESWLLFIDQFEEIFTLCTDAGRRQAFLDGLARLVEAGLPAVKLVVAMRSDFFDRFDPHPRLLELLQPAFFVTSPDESELRLCIEQPAARHGVTFEAGLVPEILQDLKGRPGALPLLQYTLDLLWREDRPANDRILNTVNYRALGGIAGALKQRADELYERRAIDRQRTRTEPRPAEQREAMRRVLLRLLDLSEQGENARAISNRASLAEFPPDEQALISELADEKLLVTNRTADQATVEVAHEALLSAWPRLNEWIAQAREAIYMRNRLRTDAAVWDQAKQNWPERADDELWTGSRLQAAIEREERGEFAQLGGLSARMHEFLNHSRALRDRRVREEQERREQLARNEQERREQLARNELEKQQQRTRFLRMGVVLLSFFLVLAGGIAYYALARQREAVKQKQAVEQRELDMMVEEGRQLLVEQDKAAEAALWLQRALERGSTSSMLPYLISQAMQPLDATRLVLQGHTDYVSSVSFSVDGGRIVTGSADQTARLWDANTGKLLRILSGHSGEVASASFSPDGSRIVTGSFDQTARLWDANSGKLLLTLSGHSDAVRSASFSPDGSRIVTGGGDETARLWDANTGKPLLTLSGHSGEVVSASFSPDGGRIVTGSWDKTARLWDANTGKLLLTLSGHSIGVWSASFSPDGRRIVTGSADQTARLWDANTGKLLLTLAGRSGDVYSASFSPDGGRIVTGSRDQTVRLWDAYTGKLLASLSGHSGAVRSASFSPDGGRIVTGSRDQTARLWNAHIGRLLLTLSGHSSAVFSASFSSDGDRIVTGSYDQTARLWDAHTGKLLLILPGHSDTVISASFSPDGGRIVTGSEDQTARLWDAHTGKLLLTLSGHSGTVRSARFSPDGGRIVTGSGDGTARLWDAHTGKLLLTLSGHSRAVFSASFSPDGDHVVTGSGDQTARLWDAKTGKLLLTLSGLHSGSVNSASFSPDGGHILTGNFDQTARLWDARTGKLLLTFSGHSGDVYSASFSPDGDRVVTGSGDQTARLWDAHTGKLLATFSGHSSYVMSASFSPDGSRIVTGGGDRIARLWSVSADPRGASQLMHTLRCRLALRLDSSAVVPSVLEPAACESLPTPEPPAPTWDQRDAPLRIGVYALQAGHTDAARQSFQIARERLSHFQDELLLAELDLAEAALDVDAPIPRGGAERLRRAPTGEQAAWWDSVAGFALDSLHRPQWALWAFEQALALVPKERDADLKANQAEALLAAGQSAEVLRRGPAVWKALQRPATKAVEAALSWLAAGQQAQGQARRSWAQRAMDSYLALEDGASLGWTFSGSRHAFVVQPESAVRTQALTLFTLLEQNKSDATAIELAKLLGVPGPQPTARSR